ncbi:hypothetical protein AAF712_005783 [Marasmius tenuissimus]|uniref:F-box domain-containing protein n=1 Tax=Marasmius tenuissimus TaxID=585030 RepID=A0ABR3A0Q2_9AGAR
MTSNVNGHSNSATSVHLPYRGTITELDRQIISHHISDTEKELRSFDIQLTRLNAELNRLKGAIIIAESRREMVNQKLANYRSLLSPIHRIPPEIMTEIFKFCCSHSTLEPHTLSNPRLPSFPPPMTISSVCGRWRELVLDTPALWASLSAYAFEANPDIRVYRAIKLFMDRSKSAPLAITAEYYGSPNHKQDYLELLVQNSRRWASLNIGILPAAFGAQIFHDLRG